MSLSLAWRRSLVAALLSTTVWVYPAVGQENHHDHDSVEQISLEEIVARIDGENPALRAARLEADALGTRPDQVSAWPDPVVGVGYQPVPMLTAHGAQRTQWMIEQTIPYPGKLSLRRDIAEFDAETAAYESEAIRDDLVLEAKVAYFELYRLSEIERLIVDFEAELQGFEEMAAVRYEVGDGPQQALLRAQLEKNQLLQRLHHIEGARRRAAETLARLTNHPEGPRYFLVTEPVLPSAVTSDAASLAADALDRRPEFAALESAARSAAREVELARKEAYPDVAVNLTYFDIASRDMPASATGRDAVAVGASVRIPLHRGRIDARIEEARLRQSMIEARQEELRTQYRTQVEELLSSLEHEALALEEYESVLLPQASSTLEATLAAYSTGMVPFQDLLDAERTIFGLRADYIESVARYLTLGARLERVLGVDSLEEIASPSASAAAPILDPNNSHE